ncbi:O-antigen ligase family protein [Edaphobacter aggregans]|uniref:O-antigen ligase family protein n=1 Tax=Edaphobacter aggregans TaxID=570835 RepID=UPI000550EA7D|nr:O-antigen ligase [Edaphobacter aggregans]
MATYQALRPALIGGHMKKAASTEEGALHFWRRASTWGLLLPLLYFALDGVSPFVNSGTAMRAVQTSSAGGVFLDRFSNILIFGVCMIFVIRRHHSVSVLSLKMKLITSFPICALLLSPVSQQITRTFSSGIVLLGGILLIFYIMSRYTLNEVLELFLVLGTGTIVASILFAIALPQYGRDLMGGHSTAWKGIFSAKNYLGNMALFFLTVAVSYRPRTNFWKSVRVSQILFCLLAIAFSRAATSYLLTAVYITYALTLKMVRGFRKKDYFVAFILLFVIFAAGTTVVILQPDFLISLLGKDATLTGRTEIWDEVMTSIVKHPLFGYGYQAFWLGFKGESYRIILAVTWALGQAQNGFLDVTLEMGVVGLIIVLSLFGFAFRDGVVCLLRSYNQSQLRAVEWYMAIVILTAIYNLDESFLFEPKHLGSMMFLLACVGLKLERMRMQSFTEGQRRAIRRSA